MLNKKCLGIDYKNICNEVFNEVNSILSLWNNRNNNMKSSKYFNDDLLLKLASKHYGINNPDDFLYNSIKLHKSTNKLIYEDFPINYNINTINMNSNKDKDSMNSKKDKNSMNSKKDKDSMNSKMDVRDMRDMRDNDIWLGYNKYLSFINISIYYSKFFTHNFDSNTVLGPTASNGPEDSTVVPGNSTNNSTTDSSSPTMSSTNNTLTTSNTTSTKDIGTVGASTVTKGKGANFMVTECTPGKGANSMVTECTTEKISNKIAVVTNFGESGTNTGVTTGVNTTTGSEEGVVVGREPHSVMEEKEYTIFIYPYMRKTSRIIIESLNKMTNVLSYNDLTSIIYVCGSTGSSRLLSFLSNLINNSINYFNFYNINTTLWPWVNSVTVLGQTATTVVPGTEDPIGPSTVTNGKGANFTAMECTTGKGANFTATECTSEENLNEIAVVTNFGESSTFLDTVTTGKGANFMDTVTTGKGANFMGTECTMGKGANTVGSVIGREPDTVTENIQMLSKKLNILLDIMFINKIINYKIDNEDNFYEFIENLLKNYESNINSHTHIHTYSNTLTHTNLHTNLHTDLHTDLQTNNDTNTTIVGASTVMDNIILEKIICLLIFKGRIGGLSNGEIRIFSDFICDRLHRINLKVISNLVLALGYSKSLDEFWMYTISKYIVNSITVLGHTDSNGPDSNGPEVSTVVLDTSNSTNNSTEDSTIPPVGPSTVTKGKGANFMPMECTSEENLNEIAVVTKTGESSTNSRSTVGIEETPIGAVNNTKETPIGAVGEGVSTEVGPFMADGEDTSLGGPHTVTQLDEEDIVMIMDGYSNAGLEDYNFYTKICNYIKNKFENYTIENQNIIIKSLAKIRHQNHLLIQKYINSLFKYVNTYNLLNKGKGSREDLSSKGSKGSLEDLRSKGNLEDLRSKGSLVNLPSKENLMKKEENMRKEENIRKEENMRKLDENMRKEENMKKLDKIIGISIISIFDLDYKIENIDILWKLLSLKIKDSYDICTISWLPIVIINFPSKVSLLEFLTIWLKHVNFTINKLRSKTYMMTIQRRHLLLRHAFEFDILPKNFLTSKNKKLLDDICNKNYIICKEDYIPESSTFHLEVCSCLRALGVIHQREINIIPFVMDIVISPNNIEDVKTSIITEAERSTDIARCGYIYDDIETFPLKYNRNSPNHRKRKQEIYTHFN